MGPREVLGGQGLQREGDVHDRGGMALGGGQVDHAAAGQEVEAPGRGPYLVLLDQREDLAHASAGQLAQPVTVDLHVKVPGVGQHRAVAHALEVLGAQRVAAAGDGDEDLPVAGGLQGGHDREALHARLQGGHRLDLADHHRGAQPTGALGDPPARPAVAQHDDGAPGQQQVRGAQDAVQRGLAGAVTVVEGALGTGLVDGHDRAGQAVLGGQCPQAHETRGGLLGGAQDLAGVLAGMQAADQLGAVVERQVRAGGHQRVDVRPVGRPVLAAARADLHAVVGDQRRGHRVLGGQRVRGTQGDLRPARHEHAHEPRRLGGDVQARGDAQALEGTLARKALTDRDQDRHLRIGPRDPVAPRGSQRRISDDRAHGAVLLGRERAYRRRCRGVGAGTVRPHGPAPRTQAAVSRRPART